MGGRRRGDRCWVKSLMDGVPPLDGSATLAPLRRTSDTPQLLGPPLPDPHDQAPITQAIAPQHTHALAPVVSVL
jgi:hypothetical protein